jgi:hypothetical protein
MAKTKESTTQYAKKLLDRLIELDYQTVEAYYDMGSIISSIQHGKLYKLLEYNSMTHLIEEELTYTPSTAFKYGQMFRHFRRLRYLKHEAVELLKKFGLTHMCEILPKMKDKIGVRAIKNRINAIDDHQINFTLTSAQLDLAHEALKKMGAMKADGGRWLNSSEAFMHMVNNVNAMDIEKEAAKLRVVK